MEPRGQVLKAMVLIQRPRDNALLVSEETNLSGALFHRPLGGHVEFGDTRWTPCTANSRRRSGSHSRTCRWVGVLENIFQWNGATQHEIVFIFTAAFADQAAYEIPEQTIMDAHGTTGSTRVIWRRPGAASPPLYPSRVADIAARESATQPPLNEYARFPHRHGHLQGLPAPGTPPNGRSTLKWTSG